MRWTPRQRPRRGGAAGRDEEGAGARAGRGRPRQRGPPKRRGAQPRRPVRPRRPAAHRGPDLRAELVDRRRARRRARRARRSSRCRPAGPATRAPILWIEPTMAPSASVPSARTIARWRRRSSVSDLARPRLAGLEEREERHARLGALLRRRRDGAVGERRRPRRSARGPPRRRPGRARCR